MGCRMIDGAWVDYSALVIVRENKRVANMKDNNQSPAKRQLQTAIQPSGAEYEYQNRLATLGMKIRQAVDHGYQTGDYGSDSVGSSCAAASAAASASAVCGASDSTGNGFANVCMQDNTRFTIPEYKRVALAKQPPMLVNQRTVSMNSNLEQWEQNLDQRLSSIDNDIMRNKLGAGDFLAGASKRSFDDLEF